MNASMSPIGTSRPQSPGSAERLSRRVAVGFAPEPGTPDCQPAHDLRDRASMLQARVGALTSEVDPRTGRRHVLGDSAPWRHALTQAVQVAPTETTVLLLGESGTGKEVVAGLVHRGSRRHAGPFVAVNCAALPEHLLEAELFGYERGAFTGAVQSKPGRIEQAAGGTLFLDEIGEMSLPAQAKLLRVLQEREFQRLGGTRVLDAHVRVVAATNRDLTRAIAAGQFREDLYYRLNVFAIRLPPLRDRASDVLPLALAFLGEISRSLGEPSGQISRAACERLLAHGWPGNVRELRNVVERAAILSAGGEILPEHLGLDRPPHTVPLPLAAAAAAPGPAAPARADLPTMERAMIAEALQNARYNRSKAARALGLTRHQLRVRMRRYGID